ncbi:hypothetical protein [Acinetobacter sp. A47]|uniref:hypothetical protein n=1 Tax=Acinetobacter sp. A47 TaxID=1561217 RepID=UPI0005700D04|nr:hypothetical protein [Acinetobacter sp. A47]
MSFEQAQLEYDQPDADVTALSQDYSDEELLALEAAGTHLEPQPEAQPIEQLQEGQAPEPEAEIDPEQLPESNADVEDPEPDVGQPTPAVEPEAAPVVEGATPTAPEATPTDEIDYKAFYEQVTRPFKANGRELQVRDHKDIITLMQQGANYDKKMAGLKPAMQVHRTLEKAGLLDAETIGYMIDLHAGKPEAIARLAKERNIDLFNLAPETAENYVPQSPLVSEQELEITSVLQELNSQPSFQETFDTLGTWDAKSQEQILQAPRMMHYFQEHKELGIFDNIVNAVAQERMFGRLHGVSDIDAYRMMGDRLYAEPQTAPAPTPQVVAPAVVPTPQPVAAPVPQPAPVAVAPQTVATNQKRAAAAAPRKATGTPTAPAYNPLTVSDDELMEIAARHHNIM